jgi:hypothetical protein
MTHIQVKRSEYELWFKSLVSASERQQKLSEEEIEESIIYRAIYNFKDRGGLGYAYNRFYGVGGIRVDVDEFMLELHFESEKDWFYRNSEIDKACRHVGGKKRVTEVLREQGDI